MSIKQEVLDWLRRMQEEKLKGEAASDTKTGDEETKIDEDVLSLTAVRAALEVPGVVDMSGGLVDDVAQLIGKKRADKGVQVDLDDGFLSVTLFLVVAFGSNIPALALSVQNRVKRSLQDLTGYEVQYVDVHIENVVEEKHEEIIQGDGSAEFISD